MGRLLLVFTFGSVVACAQPPQGSITSHNVQLEAHSAASSESWLKQDLAKELRSGGITHCGGYEFPAAVNLSSELAVSVEDPTFRFQSYEVKNGKLMLQMPGSTFEAEYVQASGDEITSAIEQRSACLKHVEDMVLSGKTPSTPLDVENVAVFSRAQLVEALQRVEAEINSPPRKWPLNIAMTGLTLGVTALPHQTYRLQEGYKNMAKAIEPAEVAKLASEIKYFKRLRQGTTAVFALSTMLLAYYYFHPEAGSTPEAIQTQLSALKRMADYDEILFTQYVRRHPDHARLMNEVVKAYASRPKARKAH